MSTPFLSDLSKLTQPAEQVALLRSWLATKPGELFAELREARPVLALPGMVVVTRYRDVVDVLARDGEFSVKPYAGKMSRSTGDFFLGMDDGPTYEREASIMRLAVSRDDLPKLERSIGEWADACVRERAASGRLDVLSDVARRVPARLVMEYFGVSGVDEKTLLRWLRAIFRDVFINPGDADQGVTKAAAVAAAEMSAHLDGLIAGLSAAHARGETLPDSVLARAVRLQSARESNLDNAGIRRNIAGIIVGASDTTSECVANVIDFLLERPELLAKASAVTRTGSLSDVRDYVLEALRFNPQAPFLTRVCLATTVVARGTPDETPVPAGSAVLVALMSAMADSHELASPDEFMPGRPARHYLHFGRGLHQCFGRHINILQIPHIVRSILQLPNLRRAPGDEGRVRNDGPFPDRLVVEFDAVVQV